MTDDEDIALNAAVALANGFLDGRLSALQTGREIVSYINPWHAAWDALGGAHGPLAAFFGADDRADRLHFLGEDVERWHPDVREERRRELRDAEAAAIPGMRDACRALVAYAADRLQT